MKCNVGARGWGTVKENPFCQFPGFEWAWCGRDIASTIVLWIKVGAFNYFFDVIGFANPGFLTAWEDNLDVPTEMFSEMAIETKDIWRLF